MQALVIHILIGIHDTAFAFERTTKSRASAIWLFASIVVVVIQLRQLYIFQIDFHLDLFI